MGSASGVETVTKSVQHNPNGYDVVAREKLGFLYFFLSTLRMIQPVVFTRI
jgi:hypothetical protein